MKKLTKSENWYIRALCLFFSLSFFVASIAACAYLDVWDELFNDWLFILFSPSPLVTDYYQLGNMASAFFNAGMCGLACTIIMILFDAECDENTLVGFFLVVAHCFYGLNFLNMWPPMIGILIFCKFYKIDFRSNTGMLMLSTAFAPFVSELLFRYHLIDEPYLIYTLQVDIIGVFYVIVFCLFLGFAIPAMLPGALRLHKGFNLYNGGLAFGLLGLFLYSFMYQTLSIDPQKTYGVGNALYSLHDNSYMGFVVSFYIIIFSILLLCGWYFNGKTFKGYGKLTKSSGLDTDFIDEFGFPLTLINMGIYGFLILAYFCGVILLTDGAGFTGATTGVILAALTFSAKGQHPKNIWPILLGFVLLSLYVEGISQINGRDIPWSLSTQGYLNGAAFATGLCPIAGHYGKRYGVLAGFICAIICTSTVSMHGGFMLYNGGLATGITALILIPCLEYYGIQPKKHVQ